MTLLPPRHWLAGLALMAAGETLRLWAVGHIGRISRTRQDEVGGLVDVGPYARLRNPLYVGNMLLFAGIGVIQWPSALLCVPLLALYYQQIVRWEEENLQEKLGDPYRDYLRRVPRWLPLGSPKTGLWSLQTALRSERSTLIAIAVILGALLLRSRLPQ
ncbi:MAG TPA: isoprenylcysteine carboxylmethyltransferase family protein [Myxococcota bacterium]|nr:isoprenylcysteine carboxylmethyltransferase family protein [Myxococcota bacterium]HND30443.1 isoprenylcysteine carboxylmethyltransferase family protein [Myxococcota bacterium]